MRRLLLLTVVTLTAAASSGCCSSLRSTAVYPGAPVYRPTCCCFHAFCHFEDWKLQTLCGTHTPAPFVPAPIAPPVCATTPYVVPPAAPCPCQTPAPIVTQPLATTTPCQTCPPAPFVTQPLSAPAIMQPCQPAANLPAGACLPAGGGLRSMSLPVSVSLPVSIAVWFAVSDTQPVRLWLDGWHADHDLSRTRGAHDPDNTNADPSAGSCDGSADAVTSPATILSATNH